MVLHQSEHHGHGTPRSAVYVETSTGSVQVCSSRVVLLPTTHLGSHHSGPTKVRRTREERLAACPTHARSPFNDLSAKSLNARMPD